MASQGHIGKRAYATRIAQKLTGPTEAILGFQALLMDEVRRSGPADALADLEKAATAAARLNDMVQALGEDTQEVFQNPQAQAKLRHDLRTPINAILGYSEMVLEDFGDDLNPSVHHDVKAVLNEVRRLSVQIDTVVGTTDEEEDTQRAQTDAAIAASLERSLSSAADQREFQTGHILVIDDELANQEILTRQLERKGHTVRAVGSAKETFEVLQCERFDLVLLDILMPDTNGIEVLARLKNDPDLREIPVVMVSGLKETDAIVKCISAGAEDYLPKPIDPVLLHARVDACLDRLRWREREIEFNTQIQYEKNRADALLHAMLPAPVIHRLNSGETQIADRFESATILFADIVDFTPLVARMDAGELVQELANLFSAFDDLATQHDIEKIKTIGDAYMAAAGIPTHRADHASAVVAFARDMIAVMSDLSISTAGLKIRVGIHTGPVIAGLIGTKRSVYDVWGETVNLASRLESTGQAGRIQISETTKDALGKAADMFQAHNHVVKGVGRITSYFVK
jgi:adenylate cyclase